MVTLAHRTGMTVLAIACIAAGISLVRNTMSPFKYLQSRLAAVRDGRNKRMVGAYPDEVQSLVNDLNALLEDREQAVRRAQAKAGDLAHGLKTPLAILAHEARRVHDAGNPELAASIEQQVERMGRQIDYHLAHARAAASASALGTRCSISESAEGLSRALRRLHVERGLTIDVQVPADHSVRSQREDFDEMLGNLLDNACKWARSKVRVASGRNGAGIFITVDDDGPGLDVSMRTAVLQRGVRADEAAPGSGFGLAIVRDLADLYGGSVTLDASPLGGLRAQLQLPA
jgi:signal transduction histidine kinase